MTALQGLSGLYPDPQDTTDYMDEGVLEARATPGTPVSDHSEYGSQYNGYSGQIPTESPFSAMSVYDGWQENDFGGWGYNAPGEEDDKTPQTHASPYPRGIFQQSWADPDEAALNGEQMMQLHGPDLGGVKFYQFTSPAGHEEETHYTTDRYDAPNENYLATLTEEQLKTGWSNGNASTGGGSRGGSNADTTQGYGELNTLHEFQMGHSIRRVQHDSAVFDYTNTHGEQNVPFLGRHPVEQMPLNGPDSPYFEAGDIDGANVVWEGRIGDPSPYEQPAEPTIGPPLVSQDVWAY